MTKFGPHVAPTATPSPSTYRRRIVLGVLGLAPIGAIFGRSVVQAESCAGAAPGEDDQAYIERLARSGGRAIIAHRDVPYHLHRSVAVAPQTKLEFADDVSIVFDPGPKPISPTEPVGVFVLTGNDTQILGARRTIIRASRPEANLYAVLARGVSRVRIENITAHDCAHVYMTAATEAYASLTASGQSANLSTQVSIVGGGATFSTLPSNAGHAACVIGYCSDFRVEGCRYENVAHGVQWWGGDADPEKDGRFGNPRKCGPGHISRIVVEKAHGASVWGSMGRAITVSDCTGQDAGDVGFDSEGGLGITFRRCSQTNAKAGCFALFFENDAIRFEDCTALQPAADQPVFRTYGKGKGDNRSVTIEGGTFRCTDVRSGSLDNAYGAIEELTIRRAAFDNIVLRLEFRPFRRLALIGNQFRYRTDTSMPVVSVGTTGAALARPLVIIRDNEVTAGNVAPELIRYVGDDARLLDRDIAGNRRITAANGNR